MGVTGDTVGIGFGKESYSDVSQSKSEPHMSKQMHKPVCKHLEKGKVKREFQRWRCHYCGRFGHLKPFCYKLYGYPEQNLQFKSNQNIYIKKKQWTPKSSADQKLHVKPKQKWVPKVSGPIAHTYPSGLANKGLLYDIGCSKDMAEIKILSHDIKPHSSNYVTLRDEAEFDEEAMNEIESTDGEEEDTSDVLDDEFQMKFFICSRRCFLDV